MYDRLGFIIIVEQGNLEYQTLLLVESIRRLPALQQSPIYVVQPRAGRRPTERTLRSLAQHDAAFIFGDLNRTWRRSGTMNKVYASAYVEALTEHTLDTLVFLESDTVLISPPDDLVLSGREVVAAVPIHKLNVAQRVDSPVSPYWHMIYENCAVRRTPDWHVTTVVDQHDVLPYFNDGVIAVQPSAGIFRQWRDNAERLARDERALNMPADSEEYFFVNQALFSGTLLGQLSREQIRILDHTYNFTLVSRTSPAQHVRVSALDDVKIFHYHRALYSSDWMKEVTASEPLEAWFRSRLPLRRQRRRISTLVRDGRKRQRQASRRSRLERV